VAPLNRWDSTGPHILTPLIEDWYMKVLFFNNYPMDKAWKLWQQGDYPGHHLWGVTHLPKYGIDVDILPYERWATLKRGPWERLLYLGDLDQQIRVLLQGAHYDMVYSACQTNTQLLSILHARGVFRKPLVATINRDLLAKTSVNQTYIDGHDRLVCLTQIMKDRLEERFTVPEIKLEVIPWGVDLPFYQAAYDASRRSRGAYEYILAAGKLMRDNDTLATAFLEINYPVFMACGPQCAPTIPGLPPHIRFRSTLVSIKELLSDYQRAYAVAIPVKIIKGSPPNSDGLTSLLEAMAMGKAVVMTRNRFVGLDIEKEGIGLWVEPGDVEGWRQAISYLLAHPRETMEMGERAHLLCEEKLNLEMFSSQLAGMLQGVWSRYH
jgi:glycosyltransferase involved in cell wall biosynthesis